MFFGTGGGNMYYPSLEEVKEEFIRISPKILGMTCGSVTYNQCVELAKAAKEVLPSCKVVVGGWHGSYLPESLLKHQEIDFVVMGEGEQASVELATEIIENEKNSDVSKIPGIAFRKDKQIVKNSPTFISDLDQIPFPARHLLPMHLYSRVMEYLDIKPVDTMNVIRGCPYNCAFCETKKHAPFVPIVWVVHNQRSQFPFLLLQKYHRFRRHRVNVAAFLLVISE